jgi:hypothetical protein
MRELRKFEVILESDVLKLGGRLVGYLRIPATYQISRSKSFKKQESSYEVNVEGLLGQFGISGEVNEEDMHKHHLSMGKDGKCYMCAFEITERNLVPTIRLWLAHQVLVEKFGIDIMEIDRDFSGASEFSKKAKKLKEINPSITFTDTILRVCGAEVKIEEI